MMLRQLKGRFSVRQLKYVSVGVTMTGLNAGVLIALVDGIGIVPILANGMRTIVTTQLHFGIHRHFTWRDRRHEPLWPQWRRFHLQKVMSTLIGQLIFLLIIFMNLHYMAAYLTSIALTGLVSYQLSNTFVFRGKPA